ncbi:hypothetical protein [Pseudomonas aeruginosa]|uniref:hypothetical protein n=1 Tax=Pseudomonas aeruginosa TaxID=287 RepID=UPI001F403DDA|nr:hypothetical protein [Pseudomonas aeruginosa]
MLVTKSAIRPGSNFNRQGGSIFHQRQHEAVTEKKQARRLRAGLYTLDGELISDSHELTFDFASDNPRERELSVRFILSRKADEANNQQVELRLEEQVEGTSHFTQYKATRYTIRRSFTSEFDF